MKTYSGVIQLHSERIIGSVTTVGNFDGVHIGHQRLIEQVVRQARTQELNSIVFTFNPHPVQVLYPERGLTRLFDLEDQQERLAALGVDILVVEPFSKEFSRLEAGEFLRRWIINPLKTRSLVVGHDFTFGADRQGTIDFLQRQSGESDVALKVVPPIQLAGEMVSSSRIRKALKAGEVELVAKLLGRSFYVRGKVVPGVGRGRTIGVPTANLFTTAETWPALGVYATWCMRGSERFASVTNVGISPTFNKDSALSLPRLETHLFEFHGDLYDQSLRVEFVKKLRDERRFANVDELKKQIQVDIVSAKEHLKDDL